VLVLGLLPNGGPAAYALLFLLVGGESTGLPLPGETALIAGALLARSGHLEIVAVLAVASAGAIVGDNLAFALSRRYGRSLLLKGRLFREHRERALERAEGFFERHGGKAVFLGRWFSGLRIATAWVAGASGMRFGRFLFWNAAGGIFWACTVGLVAYVAGHAAARLLERVGTIGGIALLALVLAVAGLFLLRRRRQRAV
jgi:membrane-associated protein